MHSWNSHLLVSDIDTHLYRYPQINWNSTEICRKSIKQLPHTPTHTHREREAVSYLKSSAICIQNTFNASSTTQYHLPLSCRDEQFVQQSNRSLKQKQRLNFCWKSIQFLLNTGQLGGRGHWLPTFGSKHQIQRRLK